MIEVIPGILEKSWEEIEKKVHLVKPFTNKIHIDLLDGKFADNLTFSDPKPFRKYTKDIFFELHMMIEKPEDHIDSWVDAGFRRFIGQIELMEDQRKFVRRVKSFGAEVGVGVDLPTEVKKVDYKNSDLDFLFVMTVKAGFSNQKFSIEALDKVRFLSENTNLPIEIDGGVSDKCIADAHSAGARRFVSTGYIFSGNPSERYQELVNLANSS